MDPFEAAKVVKDIVPVKEAYYDAVQPTARQFGKSGETLGMIVNALLSPIRRYVFNIQAKEEQLEREIAAKLENVPPQKMVDEAPLHVVVPAVQAWSYSIDCNELRILYSTLVANSMLIENQTDIHPGYVEIIKQLHPQEAGLFKAMVDQEKATLAAFKLIVCDILNPAEHSVTFKHFACIKTEDKTFPSPEHWENLRRLGLIEIDYTSQLVNEAAYQALENHPAIVRWKEDATPEGKTKQCKKGIITITALGHSFANVCIKESAAISEATG